MKHKDKKKKFTIILDLDLHNQLKLTAEKKYTSISQIVTYAVIEYLKNN